ncbi:autophagy protein 29 [Penicillium riverlandense]|uniref:autophagy protein 29 n=1 Tax=Penicillium riverlandense TaxID=1903569 RepID=UPI002548AC69|nr:autophagy protein 29 [Penicillium riverlandense]KAJ5820324.1 autophagy protein 29 [Penicillium riverlandense]
MATKADPADSKFTVFIRLPFPRGDFVDPPPVEWNASKDQALWDILSRPSKGDDIDWKALADRFDVTLQFLLQQAAWLYDRQLSQVRAQMRKVPTTQSTSPSPAPGSVSGSGALGGQLQKGPHGPSRQVSQQNDTLPLRAAAARRTSSTSTTTINQFRSSRDPSRTDTPTGEGKEQRWDSFGRRSSFTRREQPPPTSLLRSPPLQEEDFTSSSSEESEDEDDTKQAPRFKRFGKFSTHRAGLRDDEDEDDEDDTPAFLPLSRETEPTSRERPVQELGAALRSEEQRRRSTDQQPRPRIPVTGESSASSASSGVPANLPQGESRRSSQAMGALSPHQRGEVPRRSPRKSTASGREASDGTPSMGSSFSDLDDASVTQSALEEALMSNMQHGGMASRMSTISQALRSKYLP